MPILRWRCAHGEAPAVRLACAHCVNLAPPDDSVDSNVVHIVGEGTIESFGDGPPVLKRVLFEAGITLKHSACLQLLSCDDRYITTPSIGLYACDGAGQWNEVHFTATGAGELIRRCDAIEEWLDAIEARLEQLEKAQAHAEAGN